MRHLFINLTVLASAFVSSTAIAGPTTEKLISCIADSTTGKERKALAQWIFTGMAAHPDIRPMSRISEPQKEDLDKNLAQLATKLITDSCMQEVNAAIDTDGPDALGKAFNFLGQLAVKEITSDPAVDAALKNYVKYLDKAKFEKVLRSRQ